MPRKKLRVEATFRARSDGSRPDTRIPAEVRDFFGCGPNDILIFEDGCEETVTRAALFGEYVVVRRASRPGEARQVGSVKLLKPHPPAETAPPPPAPAAKMFPPPGEAPPPPSQALEPFADFVRKRCGRAGEPHASEEV